MNKKAYQLELQVNKNSYILRPLSINGIDKSKITEDVKKIRSSCWVSTDKQALINFAENRDTELLAEHEQIIQAIKNRSVVTM